MSKYQEQSDLHSSLEQEQHNETLLEMSPKQMKQAAQNVKKALKDRQSFKDSSEAESSKNFVVPPILRERVREMKELYPDASEEKLVKMLKYE